VLAPHGDAVILAGAQAVYLHTGSADLAIAPYTTDGDLVLDPLLLGDAPELEAGMSAAGFHLQPQPGGHVEPGIWLASASAAGKEFLVPVDLIVPEGAASGTGRHREVVAIEPLIAERRQAPSRARERSSSRLPPAEERRIVAGFMTEFTRKWLDEPHPQLGGCTPRHAAAGEHRADLVSLVRALENRSERARRDGEPFADVAWIREDLGLDELEVVDLAA